MAQDRLYLLKIYLLPTEALHKIYSHRTHFCKTTQDSLDYQLSLARGQWKQELVSMATSSLYNVAGLFDIDVDENSDDAAKRLTCLVEFFIRLCHYRTEALAPEVVAYPGLSVLALSTDDNEREVARGQMLHDFNMLVRLEQLACAEG